jgi:hypothetical protein
VDYVIELSGGARLEEQVYGQKLAEMTKMHSSEGFYALDYPLFCFGGI